MFLIRNAKSTDLHDLIRLAKHLNSYNLPADRAILKRMIEDSEKSFRSKMPNDDRLKFLFVAEEVKSGKVVGSSLLIARHGTANLPHLAFELGIETRTSGTLKKSVDHVTMTLRKDSRGFTEIGGLVVLPRYRARDESIGKQLSIARFAYMARHLSRFQPRMIVEYLPKLNPNTGNKLWEVVGQKFTGLTYRVADHLSARNKEFILSLFPKHKIYASLLPLSVLQNLGEPGPGAKASMKMLARLGFRFLNQIDPFDGGPHYGAATSRISLIKKTVTLTYAGTKPAPRGGVAMVMVESIRSIRAMAVPFSKRGQKVYLSIDHAQALQLKLGDKLTLTPFRF